MESSTGSVFDGFPARVHLECSAKMGVGFSVVW